MECTTCQNVENFCSKCQNYFHNPNLVDFYGKTKLRYGYEHKQFSNYLSVYKSQNFEKEIRNRIEEIQNLKKEIIEFSKELTKKLQKSIKSALEELENSKKEYISLLNLKELPYSKQTEIQEIIITTVKIKNLNFSFGPFLNEGLDNELDSFVEIRIAKVLNKDKFEVKDNHNLKLKENKEQKNKKYKENEKNLKLLNKGEEDNSMIIGNKSGVLKNFEDEIQSKPNTEVKIENKAMQINNFKEEKMDLETIKKAEKSKSDRENRKIQIQNINELELSEQKSFFSYFRRGTSANLKEQLMNSFKIKSYEDLLLELKTNGGKIEAIKFSNDGQFSFICKCYLGKSN